LAGFCTPRAFRANTRGPQVLAAPPRSDWLVLPCAVHTSRSQFAFTKACDRRTWRFGLPRDLAPGAGAQWGNLGIAHVGARADRGDAGRRVISAEEATEPHSQRKATAARLSTCTFHKNSSVSRNGPVAASPCKGMDQWSSVTPQRRIRVEKLFKHVLGQFYGPF
jgi:hypothetical protein